MKAAATLARSAWWRLAAQGDPHAGGLRILFYHRVSDDGDPLAVPRRRFREQMDFLASEGYTVVDTAAATDLLDAGPIAPKTVGLNFDDGYLDTAEEALPLLEERGFRATVYVPTAVIDGDVSLSWYRRQPPLLSWDEIVELDRGGTLRFEAHSVTHPNLLSVDDERAEREIGDSKLALEARLERTVEAFCYPAGLFSERERRLVAAAGYRVAVSCEPGVNVRLTDRFALRRRQIDARDRLIDFRAKVGGGHDSPLPFRNRYRRLRYGEGSRRPMRASAVR